MLRKNNEETDDEDLKRKKLILNILLTISIIGATIVNAIRFRDLFFHPHTRGIPIIYTLLILALFILLFWLSRINKVKAASCLLLLIYSIPLFYSAFIWGADLPAVLLLTVLIITLSGILLGARLVVISAFFINLYLVILTYFQGTGTIPLRNYWRFEKHEVSDAIVYAGLFLIISGIAYIFCIRIQRSLQRALDSEAALREERDKLEITVAERTKQLRQTAADKINQLYRLAEFGRLSSGIFHDLINPLTAVSLNLEQVKDNSSDNISPAKQYLNQALLATQRMENLIAGIKKQIQRESSITSFEIKEEIEQIIQILAYKARRANVLIKLEAEDKIKLNGDPVKFGQIISNLLANAIEATEENDALKSTLETPVIINVATKDDTVHISVRDQGVGIIPENLEKIFEPFFSTKKETGRGLGLGLASTKNIVEKNFSGTISVDSQRGQGSCFLVSLPLNHKPHENKPNLLLAGLVSENPEAIREKPDKYPTGKTAR